MVNLSKRALEKVTPPKPLLNSESNQCLNLMEMQELLHTKGMHSDTVRCGWPVPGFDSYSYVFESQGQFKAEIDLIATENDVYDINGSIEFKHFYEVMEWLLEPFIKGVEKHRKMLLDMTLEIAASQLNGTVPNTITEADALTIQLETSPKSSKIGFSIRPNDEKKSPSAKLGA